MLGALKKTLHNGQAGTGVPKRKYTRRGNVAVGRTAAPTPENQSTNIRRGNQSINDDEEEDSDDENDSMRNSDLFTSNRATTLPVDVDGFIYDPQMTAPVSNGVHWPFALSQLFGGEDMDVMSADPVHLDSQVAFLRDHQMSDWFLESNSLSPSNPSISYFDSVGGQGTCAFPIQQTGPNNCLPYMGSSVSNNSRVGTDNSGSLQVGSFQPGGQLLRMPSFNGFSNFSPDTSGSPTTEFLTDGNTPAMRNSPMSAYSGLSFGSSPTGGYQRDVSTTFIHQSSSPSTPDALFMQRTPRIEPVYDYHSSPRSTSATNHQSTDQFQRRRLSENPQFESAISAGGDAILAAGEARLALSRAQQAAGIPRKHRNNGTMGIPLTAKNYAAAGMPQISSSKARCNTKPAPAHRISGVRKTAANSRRSKSPRDTLTIDTDVVTGTFNVRTPVASYNSPSPPTVGRKPSRRQSRVKTNGSFSNNEVISRSNSDSTHPVIDAHDISQSIGLEDHNLGHHNVEFNQFAPSNSAYVSPYQPLSPLSVCVPNVSSNTQLTAADLELSEDFDFEKYFESYEAMNPETSASINEAIDLPPLPFDSEDSTTSIELLIPESSVQDFLSTLATSSSSLSCDGPGGARSPASIQAPPYSSDMSESMTVIKQQDQKVNAHDADFITPKNNFEKEAVELQATNARLSMEKAELQHKEKAAVVFTEGRSDHGRQENNVVVTAPLPSVPSVSIMSPIITTSTASNATTPPFNKMDQLVFSDESLDTPFDDPEGQGDCFPAWNEFDFDSEIDFTLFDF
jgi:hypothetical protein